MLYGVNLMQPCNSPVWCVYTMTAYYTLYFSFFIGNAFSQWLYAAVLGSGIVWLYFPQLTEM